jgi:hypothetical protein
VNSRLTRLSRFSNGWEKPGTKSFQAAIDSGVQRVQRCGAALLTTLRGGAILGPLAPPSSFPPLGFTGRLFASLGTALLAA